MPYKDNNSFSPVFIVGAIRSGTTLLRSLLNQHPDVCVDPFEANFLPFWMKSWDAFGDLSNKMIFDKFYKQMMHFGRFQKSLFKNKNPISVDQWYDMCPNYTVSGVFEALLRYDIGADNAVWLNKTPVLANYLNLANHHFPSASFLHIIRDPRDIALSQHYFLMKQYIKTGQYHPSVLQEIWDCSSQNIGQKDMVVSAQQWVDFIKKARKGSLSFRHRYFEVRYEDLLSKPEETLQNVCDFIKIPYRKEMLKLEKTLQPQSDGKVRNKIKKTNFNKYKTGMAHPIIREIEEVVGDVAGDLGYELGTSDVLSRLSRFKILYYKFCGKFNLTQAAVAKLGAIKGIILGIRLAFWQYGKKRTRKRREKSGK